MTNNGADAADLDLGDRIRALRPGDALEIWEEGNFIVKTVYLCRESVGGRTVEWVWVFLDDGSLLEASPDGRFRYREHIVLKQGTGPYEEIVAQDGALVRFEERVRAATSGRRPVHVSLEGREYRLTSTGTVAVDRLGETPDSVPWQSFSDVPGENVYFGLVETDDEDSVGVGIWTAHVGIALGRTFDPSDISEVYSAER